MNKTPTRRALLGAAVAIPALAIVPAAAQAAPVSREAWDAALAEFRTAWTEKGPPYEAGTPRTNEALERLRAYYEWLSGHQARVDATRHRLLHTPAPDAEALAIRVSLAAMHLPHNPVLAHSIGADMTRLFGRAP